MTAVAIAAVAQIIRPAEIPSQLALFDILPRERYIEGTAHGVAEGEAIFAVDLHRGMVAVLVTGLALHREPQTLAKRGLAQLLLGVPHVPFDLVHGQEAPLDQEIDQRVDRAGNLKQVGVVGAEAGVTVQKAALELPLELFKRIVL